MLLLYRHIHPFISGKTLPWSFVPGLICLYSLLLLFASCVRDQGDLCYEQPDDDALYLTVRLPEQLAGTYGSLSEVDEQQIQTLDLLSFWVDGATGEELFLYQSVGQEELVTSNGSSRTFKIRITEYNNVSQKLVLVANARSAMESLGNIAFRTPKEEVISRVRMQVSGAWSTDPFTPFPMWGETAGEVHINTTHQSHLPEEIRLLRMVARIDVSVAPGIRNEFKLREVYLYNRYDQGRVIPADGVFNKTTLTVGTATVPPASNRIEGPIAYTDMTLSDVEIAQSIYIVENHPTSVPLEATCLVVGGIYKDDPEPTYYRVDFRSTDGREFRSLLRNHNYSVHITSVLGSGYDDEDEAFRKTWKNIEVNITDWNLCDIEFSDNDRYSLRCAPAVFRFMKNDFSAPLEGSGRNHDTFVIYTDYDNETTGEKGWTATLTNPASEWLEIEDYQPGIGLSGDPDDELTCKFRLTSDYNQASGYDGKTHFRHTALKVRAGKLIKYIDFYQTNEVWVEGEIEGLYDWVESDQSDSELDGPYRLGVSQTLFELYKKEIEELSFQVSTDHPGGYETYVDPGNGDPGWLSIVSGGELPTGGEETLTFSLSHNNVHYDRYGRIVIKAGSLVKTVHIRQLMMIDGGVDLEMDWVYSDHSDNTLDGPYKLGVTHTYYRFLSNAQTRVSFYLTTDHPGGYTATVVEGDSWLGNISPAGSSTAVTNQQITFDLEVNNSVDARGGKILVQSGNLKKYLIIEQLSPGSTGGTDIPMYWEESPQSSHELDGPYKLGVSETMYEVTKNEQEHSFLVTTTYRDGFNATVEMDDDAGSNWLRILSGDSSTGTVTNQTLKFTLSENNTMQTRTGRILLEAGNLKKIIPVTQLSTASGGIDTTIPWEDSDQSAIELDGPYKLTVGKGEYLFSNEAHNSIVCSVLGQGGGTWEATTADSWINLTTSSGAAGGNTTSLVFDIPSYGGSTAREGSIRLTLEHGGNRIAKEVKVVQYGDNRIETSTENSYKADQLQKHYFTLRSHSGWSVAVTSDPGNVVRTLSTTGGSANADAADGAESTKVYFALNDLTGGTYTATFTITSLTGMYQPYQVTITVEGK